MNDRFGGNIFDGIVPPDYTPPATASLTQIPALVFFLSLDLAGSTALKTHYPDWAAVIREFYSSTVSQMKDVAPAFKTWNYIGDEVVFFSYVRNLDDLIKWTSVGFRVQRTILQSLREKYTNIKAPISVKATAWIAPVTAYLSIAQPIDGPAQAELNDMIAGIHDVQFSDHNGNTDFIGPSIDAGFRISKFTRPLQLSISPALAYYFYKDERTNDVKVVAFEALKGVAHGQLYPAIWYHENWDQIATDFSYAERFTDEIVQRVCGGRHEQIRVLDEVKNSFNDEIYFFEIDLLKKLVAASGPYLPA